jgi:hypothetical protein
MSPCQAARERPSFDGGVREERERAHGFAERGARMGEDDDAPSRRAVRRDGFDAFAGPSRFMKT